MRRCKSTNIGDLGEAKALYEFTKLEIPVSVPTSNNLPYDLIIDCAGDLLKVQVKTRSKLVDGKFKIEICRNNAFTGEHFAYDNSDVDLFFLYCVDSDICCLVPKKEVSGMSICLRFLNNDTLNGQKVGIKYIEDYSILSTLQKLGYEFV